MKNLPTKPELSAAYNENTKAADTKFMTDALGIIASALMSSAKNGENSTTFVFSGPIIGNNPTYYATYQPFQSEVNDSENWIHLPFIKDANRFDELLSLVQPLYDSVEYFHVYERFCPRNIRQSSYIAMKITVEYNK